MENNLKWYVIRVLNGHEKKIKEYLEHELERSQLKSYVKKVLVPMEKSFQTRKNKKISVDKVLYPGYVFINADLTTGEVIPAVKAIPGVSTFVGPKGGSPSPMSDSEVRDLLRSIDALVESAESFSTDFHKGEFVRIAFGPFDGFNGTIENVNLEKRTVKIDVKIFGRITPVELAIEHIEKV